MTSRHRALVAMFAVVGLLAAGTSLYVHYRLLTEPGFSSICDVNATISCTQAYLSPYGELWGVPVALEGLLYFAVVLAIAAFAWRPAAGGRAPAYIFLLSLPALAFIAYLAYAAFFVLNAFCILCAITYVAVVAIAVVSWLAIAEPIATAADNVGADARHAASSPAGVATALVLIAATVVVVKLFPRGNTSVAQAASPATFESLPAVSDDDRARLAQWWELQPKVVLPVDGGGAKVVVVKFNDYQCPPCRQTFEMYEPIFRKHAQDVKFVLKHYPLESECNLGSQNVHLAACEAAAAVNMARAKGTADRLERWLFAHQGPPALTPTQVREAARDVGGIADFDAQYPKVLAEVREDAALGNQLKVTGTPTFFINNRRVPSILAPQYFNVLIELEANRP